MWDKRRAHTHEKKGAQERSTRAEPRERLIKTQCRMTLAREEGKFLIEIYHWKIYWQLTGSDCLSLMPRHRAQVVHTKEKALRKARKEKKSASNWNLKELFRWRPRVLTSPWSWHELLDWKIHYSWSRRTTEALWAENLCLVSHFPLFFASHQPGELRCPSEDVRGRPAMNNSIKIARSIWSFSSPFMVLTGRTQIVSASSIIPLFAVSRRQMLAEAPRKSKWQI